MYNKKRYKELRLRERSKTMTCFDDYFDDEGECSSDLQKGLSKSQPSMMVAVDTTGAGFERMASFRRSATGNDLVQYVDRKRRRRTVTGITDNIMQEIKQFEDGRRILREGPRKYSLDNLDTADIDAKDEMMQQFLKEIDNQRAEREEQAHADKDKKLLKFFPCQRSRSLPRCVKLLSETFAKREPSRTSLYIKRSQNQQRVPVDEMRIPKEENSSTTVHNFGGSSASIGSAGTGRLSRASRRSSMLGNKIKSLMNVKRRPKSLDFDSVGVIDEDDKKKKRQDKRQVAERSVSMSRIGAAAPAPEAVPRTLSSESTIGPGSYYYFDSNTIPRAQQRKYNFPWDSLPKDWTTAVRLREITKRRKEDRQSSSGNWSASGYSSNRQSLDSDAKPVPNLPAYLASQNSIGRDSGRDSPNEEKDGLDTGYMGDATSMESISDTKSMSNTDSDDWIKSLAERAASRGDVSSTSADALVSLSRLTKENIRNLDILVPGRSPRHRTSMALDEDGESSVYSLDQDGFYTSFHNDSGLRRSSNNLLEEDEDLMMPRIRECKSLQSMSSHSTNDSSNLFRSAISAGKLTSSTLSSSYDSSRQNTAGNWDKIQPGDSEETADLKNGGIEYGETGTLKAARKNKTKKKVPPPPPPRTSSSLRVSVSSNDGKDNSEIVSNGGSSPTLSESSDQETIYARLKAKTRISAQAIPSLCSHVMSDDEDAVSRDTLSASCERLNAEATEIEEIVEGVRAGKLPGTLPRVKNFISPKHELEEFEYPANSWPRLKKLGLRQQQQSILKTPEKDRGKSPSQKTLNFDPVVNLFDPLSPGGGGRQMPLSRLSSSDESSSSPPSNFISSFDSPSVCTNKMDVDFDPPGNEWGRMAPEHNTEVSSEWHQQLSSTPMKYPSNSLELEFESADEPYTHPPSFVEAPSQDSFYGLESKPLGFRDKNSESQGSTSTIALSDIDTTSLTHVSTSSSTPSGSTLSLNWDTDYTPNVTPMPTPALQHRVIGETGTLNNLSALTSDGEFTTQGYGSDLGQFRSTEFKSSPNISQLPPPPLPPPRCPSSSSLASPPLPPPPLPPKLSTSSISPSSLYNSSNYPASFQSMSSNSNAPCSDMDRSIHTYSKDVSVPLDDKVNNNNNNNNNYNNTTSNTRVKHQYSYSSESSSDIPRYHSHNGDKNDASHFSFPESNVNMPKSNSWSEDENSNLCRSKKSVSHPNSFQYNPSWSGGGTNKYQVRLSHPNRGQSQQSPVSDRRRSSPVAVDISSRNQWNSSNNTTDMSQRRRSGSHLMSPTDSGFGSPSVPVQPNTPSFSTTSTHNDHSTSNRSSLPSSSSSYNYQNTAIASSKVPHIKQPLYNNDSPSTFHKQPGQHKSQCAVKPLSASHSNDSLNSHISSSSSKPLVSQNSNLDYSRPVLLRGSSNESLKSNSSAGRSDSYRVAQMSDYDDKTSLLSNCKLAIPPEGKYEERKSLSKYNTRSYSMSSTNPPPTVTSHHRSGPPLVKSMSTPAPSSSSSSLHANVPKNAPINSSTLDDADVFNRADSYRCAMQNTENVSQVSWMARNTSYRLATGEDDVVFNSRMDFYNMWTGTSGGTRDVKRMGITDVDQLKTFEGNHDTGSGNKSLPETVHARKKLSVKENGFSSPGDKSSGVQLRQTARSNTKDKGKNKSQSSSYIRFDPIFESREDIRASKESLRPPSITSIRTLTKTDSSETLTAEKAHLMSYKRTPKSPTRRRTGSQGRRSGDEKSGFLGTLKTTIKSIGGGKGEN